MRRGGVLGLLLAMVVLLFLSQAAISVGGGEAQREPFHPLMETAVRLREASERFWACLLYTSSTTTSTARSRLPRRSSRRSRRR